MLGAHLGVVAARFDLYNRARNDAANTYERPAREVGGGIEFKHPCAAKNARGAPSMKRRDHLLLACRGGSGRSLKGFWPVKGS